MSPTSESERLGRGLLLCATALGALLRLWLSFHDDGIYWPDEIYQSLEPAHRWVFGYGITPWEFIDGARNWTFPGLLGVALKLLSVAGLDSPRSYLWAVKLGFSLVGLATGWGTFRLARALGAGAVTAAVGASVVLLGAPFVYFSPRAMSETASALPVVWGLALALRNERRSRLLGAALLGFAVLLRLHNGVFCLGLLVMTKKRERLEALGVLAGFALFYGLLDLITWGGFFHSAIKYLQFNLVEGKAAQWGTSHPTYYVRVLFYAMPLVTLGMFGFACAAWKRAPVVLGTAVAFLLLHMVTPHKELRFVLPVLPVFCALAAVGLETLRELPRLAAVSWAPWRPLPQQVALGAMVFGVLLSGVRLRELTFGDLGQYENERPLDSAFDDNGAVNRMLLAAYDRRDLCGIKVEATHLAWAGGYTYLHRNVPLYPSSGPPRESGFFNYVVAHGGNGDVIAREGPVALMRVHTGGCVPDPSYSERLP